MDGVSSREAIPIRLETAFGDYIAGDVYELDTDYGRPVFPNTDFIVIFEYLPYNGNSITRG